MARYELREIGVLDRDTATTLFVSSPEWADYLEWLALGNIPDPMPVVPPDYDRIREDMWSDVKQMRQRCTEGGAMVVVDGVDKWFNSDTYSRTQWLGMLIGLLTGKPLPTEPWRTMDGTEVVITAAIAQQVFTAIVAKEEASYARGKVLREALAAAADPRTVDITAGWPESYQ